MAFALLELYRVINIALGQYFFNGYRMPNEEWIFTILSVAVLIAVAWQRKLPVTALTAAFLIPKFEMVMGAPSISTPLFVYFMFFLSMWSWLVGRYELRLPENHTTAATILNRLYFLLFASYGILNLLSAFAHLKDPYWMSGDAMEMIFSHPFWGRLYATFRNFRAGNPGLAETVMHGWTYAVLFSQLLLIPLYLFKTGRKLLILWFIILLVNLFVYMRVVMLPHFTLLLFLLLFIRRFPHENGAGLLRMRTLPVPLKRYMVAHFVLFGLLFLLKTPYLSQAADKAFWFVREWDTRVWLHRRTAQMGFFQPVVLNADHVQGHRRFVLSRKINGQSSTVELLGPHGERRSYWPDPLMMENQGLEMIYANCMGHITALDSFSYQNNPTPYKWKGKSLERLMILDYRLSGLKGDAEYTARLYERNAPHAHGRASWDFSEHETEVLRYMYNGKDLRRITR